MSARRGALPLGLAVLALTACTPDPQPAPPPPAPPTSTVLRFGNPPGTAFGAEVTLPAGYRLTVSTPRPIPTAELPADARRPGKRAVVFTVTVVNTSPAPQRFPDPTFSGSFAAHDSAEVVSATGRPTEELIKLLDEDKPIPAGGTVRVDQWLLLPDRPGVLQLKGLTRAAADSVTYEGEV
ncbi:MULTISPECIES: hypothetical protein [unclassified Crossiella]|uniref:hypothetical protein n=1 Tax=unclassified Crossiella TaxID=2620835 RepID=UPI001FFEC7C6|nr:MULTISPECIES: hypothetical protein [unclassified Crossiella]MCK2236466.1 hypothetical protein [Crossiella sp. S99.2]MCK2250133.1 hypothetical protein [Crossiella sp. S99.1]